MPNLQIYPHHKFSVDDYYKMAEVGILNQDSRVELIEGEILQMVPIGSKHASTVDRLTKLLIKTVPDEIIVRSQNPLRLPNNTEPEPDIMLLKPRSDDYADSHPTPGDVLLIIEVSDSSINYDREVKLPLYARHGIPEVWVVDLNLDIVWFYPLNERYRAAEPVYFQRGEILRIKALPDVEINIADVLGKKI